MRIRWLKIGAPCSMGDIHNKLKNNPFLPGKSWGFELDDSGSELSAKYVEENKLSETIIDPFGNEETIEYVRYTVFNLLIIPYSGHTFLVRLDNPPKSLKSFANSLYELIGFGLVIQPIDIDLHKFIRTLKTYLHPHAVKVSKVKVSGVRLNAYSSAAIEITSSVDAYDDLISQYRDKEYTIEKVKINYQQKSLELSRSGSFHFQPDLLDIATKVSTMIIDK